MEESLDITKLTKLFSYLYNTKTEVEFADDEVEEFNSYIKNNDVTSIVHLFESKEVVCDEVFKDMLYSKVDDLWQFIMDESYKNWEHNGMSRTEFLNKLTDYEKLAVMFGNFNYQVENGGLSQWDENDYSEDLDSLTEFLKTTYFSKREEFLSILESFSDIKNAIEELDPYDDWYNEDCETRLKALDNYDSAYYRIKDDWKDFFENYLVDNITDEYKDKIIKCDLSSVGI